jgi:Fic family protein
LGFCASSAAPALPADWELSRSVSEADRALSELAGLGRTIPNPHLLIGPFVRREAVLSSRIEGTRADIADLYAYEAGQLPLPGMESPPPQADVREVLNHVRALEYGLQRLLPLLYLSAFFHRHRQQYDDLLLESSAGGACRTPSSN